jgi:hypothetical protein
MRELIQQHFNLNKYLSLRVRESPILKHLAEAMPAMTPPGDDTALAMDKGEISDCTGRLRADRGRCPHCGRLACDLGTDYEIEEDCYSIQSRE